MDKPFFEDAGMVRMERFMDLAVRRQKLISSNLSNVDTPGYKTVDIDFEQELQSQMAGSAGQGISMAVTDTRHLDNFIRSTGRAACPGAGSGRPDAAQRSQQREH